MALDEKELQVAAVPAFEVDMVVDPGVRLLRAAVESNVLEVRVPVSGQPPLVSFKPVAVEDGSFRAG